MAPQDFENGVAALFNSKRLSDVTIYCGERSWHAHKLVICVQSDWFMKACGGNFKEAETSRIDLEDDDPEVVEALLEYLYKRRYTMLRTSDHEPLNFHVKVFALAEKLFVDSLSDFASIKFRDYATICWNYDDFVNAITEWSTTTTDFHKVLGDRIADVIMMHTDELLQDEITSTDFHKALAQAPWLGAELARRLHAQLKDANSIRYFRCNDCRKIFMAKIQPHDTGRMSCPACHHPKAPLDLDYWVTFHEVEFVMADRDYASHTGFLVDEVV